jgi:hypothetical protein
MHVAVIWLPAAATDFDYAQFGHPKAEFLLSIAPLRFLCVAIHSSLAPFGLLQLSAASLSPAPMMTCDSGRRI